MASIKQKITSTGEVVYQVQVSAGRGRRITRNWKPEPTWSGKTLKRELQKFAATLETEAANGKVVTHKERQEQAKLEAIEAAKVRTLKQYVTAVFMPEKCLTFSENARCNYQQCFDNHIFPVLGNQLMQDITPAMLKQFFNKLQGEGKSYSTVIKHYTILHSLFKAAVMDDSISINPMDKVPRPKQCKDDALKKTEPKAYTVEELKYILECLQNEPLKWRAFVTLLADTGCRRGEACGLQWQSINFETNTITIERNLQYTPQKGVFEASPKNGKRRTVDISPEVAALLKEIRQNQPVTVRWVFTKEDSAEPMHPQSPTRYFKKFAQRYEVSDFHPHKLRHTNASIAITNGADIVSESQRLGHADASTTLRMYAHANEESIRRAGQIVRDALKEKEA